MVRKILASGAIRSWTFERNRELAEAALDDLEVVHQDREHQRLRRPGAGRMDRELVRADQKDRQIAAVIAQLSKTQACIEAPQLGDVARDDRNIVKTSQNLGDRHDNPS